MNLREGQFVARVSQLSYILANQRTLGRRVLQFGFYYLGPGSRQPVSARRFRVLGLGPKFISVEGLGPKPWRFRVQGLGHTP